MFTKHRQTHLTAVPTDLHPVQVVIVRIRLVDHLTMNVEAENIVAHRGRAAGFELVLMPVVRTIVTAPTSHSS